MENPEIKVKVKHSESKNAWNIVSSELGKKYKVARIPYLVIKDSGLITEINKSEALRHAKFISLCFNNSDKILNKL